MGDKSNIEWTDATWNPVAGCTKVSPGCQHCYAMGEAYRKIKHPNPKVVAPYAGTVAIINEVPQWTNVVRTLPERLDQPLRWKRARRIFVNSMSDLLHDGIPEAFIQEVFAVMAQATQHQFQILTKRAERLEELAPRLPWGPHMWMGVSVESADYLYRLDHLRNTGAAVRFVSAEPLLGPLPNMDLAGIHWVIVGAESGSGARPMDCAWAKEIKDQCQAASVPFFLKQKATPDGRKIHLPVLDGQQWTEYPEALAA